MKITKDTKIGDLIFEGFDLCSSKDEGALQFKIESVFIKRKEVEKDFEWYKSHYFNQDIRWNISVPRGYVRDLFYRECYRDIPREIKFGLFSIIAHDTNTLMDELNYYFVNKEFSTEIKHICPRGFLESIFK